MKYFPVVSPRVSRYEPARRAAWEQSRLNISPCAAHCVYYSMTLHWDVYRLMRVGFFTVCFVILEVVGGVFYLFTRQFSTKDFLCILAVHNNGLKR